MLISYRAFRIKVDPETHCSFRRWPRTSYNVCKVDLFWSLESDSWTCSSFLFSWGESAGATSVGYHLVMNDGNSEGLFHGAFMVRLLFENLCGWISKRERPPIAIRFPQAPARHHSSTTLVRPTRRRHWMHWVRWPYCLLANCFVRYSHDSH